MDGLVSQLATLLDLDARHKELLERVSDLDRRVERTLTEWTRGRKEEGGRMKEEG